MSPVIYTPSPWCNCQPPMRKIGPSSVGFPAYRVDTIWACDDCGQRWIVVATTCGGPTIAGRTVTRFWWRRHDKDTP